MTPTTQLNEAELARLKELCLSGWNDSQIADALGRRKTSIAYYRKTLGLIKDTKTGQFKDPELQKLAENPTIPPPKKGSKIISATQDRSDSSMVNKDIDKAKVWKAYFKTTAKYKRLGEQHTASSLEYFAEQWAKYHVQFEDLTATEEDMIELLITFKIRIEDNQKNYKEAEVREKELRKELGGKSSEELDLEDERQRWLFQMINDNNRYRADINKDFKDMTEKYEKIQRSLNGTREQRENNTKIGGDTFLTLVRSLNEEGRRKEVGLWNERMRLATELQLRKFKQNITFDDGVVEPMIMDGADYVKGKEERDNDTSTQ